MNGPEIPILFFGGFIAIAVFIAYLAKKAADARTAALAAMAASRGLSFIPGIVSDRMSGGFLDQLFADRSQTDEGRLLVWFQGFVPFGIGHSPIVRNVIHGPQGDLYWVVFDYSYEETHSDGERTSTTTYNFTVACARVPVTLPRIDLSAENFLKRIGAKLGYHEMTFESEEFNRRYFVRASDEKEAYGVLHPKAIEFFLSRPTRHWQICGPQVILVENGTKDPGEIAGLMDEIGGFVALLPNYVKQDKGFAANWQGPF